MLVAIMRHPWTTPGYIFRGHTVLKKGVSFFLKKSWKQSSLDRGERQGSRGYMNARDIMIIIFYSYAMKLSTCLMVFAALAVAGNARSLSADPSLLLSSPSLEADLACYKKNCEKIKKKGQMSCDDAMDNALSSMGMDCGQHIKGWRSLMSEYKVSTCVMDRDCINTWEEDHVCSKKTVTMGEEGKNFLYEDIDCVELWELYGNQNYDDWSLDTWNQKRNDQKLFLNKDFFKTISQCAKNSTDPKVRWTCVTVS